jgi:hypothetical protein
MFNPRLQFATLLCYRQRYGGAAVGRDLLDPRKEDPPALLDRMRFAI